jgi:hypothetical protein
VAFGIYLDAVTGAPDYCGGLFGNTFTGGAGGQGGAGGASLGNAGSDGTSGATGACN